MGGNAFHLSPMGGVTLVLDTKGVLLATVSQRFTACFAISRAHSTARAPLE